jgi:hypothetical protein
MPQGERGPRATLDVFVDLRAPGDRDLSGELDAPLPGRRAVRVGPNANDVFWVQILVGTPGSASGAGTQYYDNRTLSGQPKAVRYDEEIDFDWEETPH